MRIMSIIILSVMALAICTHSEERNQGERDFINAAYQQLSQKLRQIEVEDLSELAQKKDTINAAREGLEKIKKMAVANKDPLMTKSPEELEALEKKAREELECESNFYKELKQKFKQKRIETMYEKQELDKHLKAWEEIKSEREFVSLTGVITKIASKYNVTANVTWKTIPNHGALIYYQSIFQRDKGDEPTSLNNPSETIEEIAIGYYYIWSVRSGKPTSDINRRFWITEKTSLITVVENSQ